MINRANGAPCVRAITVFYVHLQLHVRVLRVTRCTRALSPSTCRELPVTSRVCTPSAAGITCYAVHPGVVATYLQSAATDVGCCWRFALSCCRPCFKSPENGAKVTKCFRQCGSGYRFLQSKVASGTKLTHRQTSFIGFPCKNGHVLCAPVQNFQ